MIPLLVALAMVASPQAPRQSDSVVMRARVRSAETKFMMEWRRIWLASYREGHLAPQRLQSLHCHPDGSYQGAAPHAIRGSSMRAMCPIWYVGGIAGPEADEREGIDHVLPPPARERARALRASVLALLDSVALRLPTDSFVAGQRVRLALDQGEPQRAEQASRACGASPWCGLLRGLVLYRSAAVAAADSAFVQAIAGMPAQTRCDWNDPSALFPERDRPVFRAIPCARRDPVVERFWWLADPLYVEPGNARRAEHYARRVTVELHSALTVDERWDWLDEHGGDAISEMLVRYGWPSFMGWGGAEEDEAHFDWLNFADSSVNVSPEYVGPRVHTAPDLAAATTRSLADYSDSSFTPARTDKAPFFESRWWAIEHFKPVGGSIGLAQHQHAVFRREHDALMLVSSEPPPPDVARSLQPSPAATLIVGRGPGDSIREVARVGPGTTRMPLRARVTAGPLLVSAEWTPPPNAPGSRGRARFGTLIPAPLTAFTGDSVAVSDMLLFAPPTGSEPLPDNVDRVAPLMLPSTTIAVAKVGVLWEMYGVAPGDSVDVSIRITQTDRPGMFARLVSSIGLGRGSAGSVTIRWREPQPGQAGSSAAEGPVPVQTRAVVIDLGRLPPGGYRMDLSIARPGHAAVTTRRTITVERRP